MSGFDANALYPSTLLKEMPCGPGKVVHYENPTEKVGRLETRLRTKKWFGFAKVDIRVPNELWEKFEEFRPLFYNSCVPTETIPKHMKAYLKRTKRSRSQTKKLRGRFTGKRTAICPALGMVSRAWSRDHDGVKSLHGSWTR